MQVDRTREAAAELVREKALIANQLEDEYRLYVFQVCRAHTTQ